jgi:hypothetical protein
MKLRDLKAYVVLGSFRTGQEKGQIQSMDPSSLMPGEQAKIVLGLSCDFATQGGCSCSSDRSIVVTVPDVSGKVEDLEKSSRTSPFEGAAGPASRRGSPNQEPP